MESKNYLQYRLTRTVLNQPQCYQEPMETPEFILSLEQPPGVDIARPKIAGGIQSIYGRHPWIIGCVKIPTI